jgi:rhodanese-related sulfurtransferase
MRRIYFTLFVAMTFMFTCLSANADLIEANNEQLGRLIEGGVTIIDVRRADEWAETGVIEGSHPATFFDRMGRYDAPKWLHQLALVADRKSPVILICHSGNRSKTIGQWLTKKIGYEKVYNVTEGIDSWIKSGRPTVLLPKG